MKFQRKQSFYEKYIKRILDIICSGLAIVVFCWLYAIIAVLVRIKLGKPVLFKQPRPGIIDPKTGRERIFNMYKFRTMTDERDENGNLLPDEVRLTKFGKALRATSLDELPEAFNIFKGDMSIIGPRPQLVRDMVFMTDEQRMRHTAKPGLSGLAQVKGRNAITWEEKLNWDLKYIENVSFWNDIKIVLLTIKTAFIKAEGITDGENATALDYGDALLKEDKVSKEKYDVLQAEALNIITEKVKSADG
jgi:capsular polysaccharide biosynthesis protein cps4E